MGISNSTKSKSHKLSNT